MFRTLALSISLFCGFLLSPHLANAQTKIDMKGRDIYKIFKSRSSKPKYLLLDRPRGSSIQAEKMRVFIGQKDNLAEYKVSKAETTESVLKFKLENGVDLQVGRARGAYAKIEVEDRPAFMDEFAYTDASLYEFNIDADSLLLTDDAIFDALAKQDLNAVKINETVGLESHRGSPVEESAREAVRDAKEIEP